MVANRDTMTTRTRKANVAMEAHTEAFPQQQKKHSGDGGESKASDLSRKLVDLLDFPKNISEYIQPTLLFCNLRTVEFEPEKKLPARQKMWSWFLKCLRGPRTIPGQYYYLVDEVKPYDISYLFKRLCQVLEQVTICSLDDELEAVIKVEFNPQTQNIFSFIADLRKAIKRLHDLNERLPKEGQLNLPDTYLRSRMVRAARQVPVYKPVIDALLIKPVEEWSKITSEQLYLQLEQVCANDRSTDSEVRVTPITADSIAANSVHVQKKKGNERSKEKTCFEFARGGSCSKPKCPYLHSSASNISQPPTQRSIEQKGSADAKKPLRPQKLCEKCGAENHATKECKFTGKCGWCAKDGHKEIVCRTRNAGRPKALILLKMLLKMECIYERMW